MKYPLRWNLQAVFLGRNESGVLNFGICERVPIVLIPPPAWEVGGPEKASQKGELFESSVIQKRPFNVRTWGAEQNVGTIAVN